MNFPKALLLVSAAVLAFAGCGSPASTPAAPQVADVVDATRPVASPSAPTSSAITIRYEEEAQFEISLPSGRRIYIDVGDPSLLERAPNSNDVLLTTVLFPHHYDGVFATDFPGKKIVAAAGELKLNDMRALSFDASSLAGDIDHQAPTDQMVLIEAAGLRILACGDEAQEQLTTDQKASIAGSIDIALCPITDIGNNPDPTGRKMFNVINELKPKLLLPTHSNIADATKGVTEWVATYAGKAAITVSRSSLPAKTTMLFIGDQAANFGVILKLEPATAW